MPGTKNGKAKGVGMSNVHQLDQYRSSMPDSIAQDDPMPEGGWLKLYRSLEEASFYGKPMYVAAWVHILMKASHKPHKTLVADKSITIFSGQFVSGQRKLSKETGISEQTIKTILAFFIREEMITRKAIGKKASVFTVVNFRRLNNQKTNPRVTQQTNPPTNPQTNPPQSIQGVASSDMLTHESTQQLTHDQHVELTHIQEYNNINNKKTCQSADANDLAVDDKSSIENTDQQVTKTKSPSVPFAKIAESYNELIGDDFPKVQSVKSSRRQSTLRKFWKEMECDFDRVNAYFSYFSRNATQHQRGANGWVADINYICRDTTIETMREMKSQ
jgi:hypothetical protein